MTCRPPAVTPPFNHSDVQPPDSLRPLSCSSHGNNGQADKVCGLSRLTDLYPPLLAEDAAEPLVAEEEAEPLTAEEAAEPLT